MKNKSAIIATPATAYISALGGLEIKTIADEYIICVSGAWCSTPSAHRLKIRYTGGGRSFIKVSGLRIHLDEMIRC